MSDQPQPVPGTTQHRVVANPRRLRLSAPLERRPDERDGRGPDAPR